MCGEKGSSKNHDSAKLELSKLRFPRLATSHEVAVIAPGHTPGHGCSGLAPLGARPASFRISIERGKVRMRGGKHWLPKPPAPLIVDQGPVMARGRIVGQPCRAATNIQKVGPSFLSNFPHSPKELGPNNGPPLGVEVAVQIDGPLFGGVATIVCSLQNGLRLDPRHCLAWHRKGERVGKSGGGTTSCGCKIPPSIPEETPWLRSFGGEVVWGLGTGPSLTTPGVGGPPWLGPD